MHSQSQNNEKDQKEKGFNKEIYQILLKDLGQNSSPKKEEKKVNAHRRNTSFDSFFVKKPAQNVKEEQAQVQRQRPSPIRFSFLKKNKEIPENNEQKPEDNHSNNILKIEPIMESQNSEDSDEDN